MNFLLFAKYKTPPVLNVFSTPPGEFSHGAAFPCGSWVSTCTTVRNLGEKGHRELCTAHVGANQSILLGQNPRSRRIKPARVPGLEKQEPRAVAAVCVLPFFSLFFLKDALTSNVSWCCLTTDRDGY